MRAADQLNILSHLPLRREHFSAPFPPVFLYLTAPTPTGSYLKSIQQEQAAAAAIQKLELSNPALLDTKGANKRIGVVFLAGMFAEKPGEKDPETPQPPCSDGCISS